MSSVLSSIGINSNKNPIVAGTHLVCRITSFEVTSAVDVETYNYPEKSTKQRHTSLVLSSIGINSNKNPIVAGTPFGLPYYEFWGRQQGRRRNVQLSGEVNDAMPHIIGTLQHWDQL